MPVNLVSKPKITDEEDINPTFDPQTAENKMPTHSPDSLLNNCEANETLKKRRSPDLAQDADQLESEEGSRKPNKKPTIQQVPLMPSSSTITPTNDSRPTDVLCENPITIQPFQQNPPPHHPIRELSNNNNNASIEMKEIPSSVLATKANVPDESFRHQIQNQVWIWEQLLQREQLLIERVKSFQQTNNAGEAFEKSYYQLHQEIRSFFEHKMKVLLPLMDLAPIKMENSPQVQQSISSVSPTSMSSSSPNATSSPFSHLFPLSSSGSSSLLFPNSPHYASSSPSPSHPMASSSSAPSLSITQQPSDIIIANRYIVPPPAVTISYPKSYLAHHGSIGHHTHITLVLSASLYYHLTDKEVSKTIDGKQDVLQGVKRISIDLHSLNNGSHNGNIVFSKLKIAEVSSKHKHQPFSLIFAIEEYIQGNKRIIASVKSNSFQVLSRPTTIYGQGSGNMPGKRGEGLRRSMEDMGGLESGSNNNNDMSCDDLNNTGDTLDGCQNDSINNTNISSSGSSANHMILQDITDLLTLPQKEAAFKLGISESMLCKRFKESTRRKWPYRYLRKLDKVIKMLHIQESDGSIPTEDKDKLDRLVKEKEECLRPVKIRITANDRINSLNSSGGNVPTLNNLGSASNGKQNGTSGPNGSPTTPTRSASPVLTRTSSVESSLLCSGESSEDDDSHDDQFVLETLEMLKAQKTKQQQEQEQQVV